MTTAGTAQSLHPDHSVSFAVFPVDTPIQCIVADEDRMISPALQRQTANRMNADVSVLQSGHLPFLSKPKETADVVLAAVEFVRCKCKAR
jgi:pimeloyl-ACP methyl ester carboxylesterase